MTFKCLVGEAPPYLQEFCCPLSTMPNRNSNNRSANQGNLFVPKSLTKRFSSRCFGVAAPTIFNKLPAYLKKETHINVFAKKLKTHFF